MNYFGRALRRFESHNPPGSPWVLTREHPAATGAHTRYPATVVWPGLADRVLKSGMNSRKIGRLVTKGKWRGMPIFTLTLEERRTCPSTCGEWLTCLAPGTRVLTAAMRWIPVEALPPGARIAAFDEEPLGNGGLWKRGRRKTRVAVVEAVGEAIQPSYEVRTDRGAVVASAGHMWLARRKHSTREGRKGYQWIETADLRADDTILYFAAPWDEDLSHGAGRVRGFVEGEGHVTVSGNNSFPKARVGWGQLPGKLLNEINALVEERGFKVAAYDRISGVNASTITLVDVCGGWREVLHFLGVFRPTRLIERAEKILIDHALDGRGAAVARVLDVVPVGRRPVVTLKTSTGTLIAEGLCSHNCYGNKMHWSERFMHGKALEWRLGNEISALQRRHPHGFVVRLHVLGDFYSVAYVKLWLSWLRRFPALHVFGYTAWPADHPIGALLKDAGDRLWSRFAIRLSHGGLGERSTEVVDDDAAATGIVCPAQTDRSDCCGTCALCWGTRRNIAFLRH